MSGTTNEKEYKDRGVWVLPTMENNDTVEDTTPNGQLPSNQVDFVFEALMTEVANTKDGENVKVAVGVLSLPHMIWVFKYIFFYKNYFIKIP